MNPPSMLNHDKTSTPLTKEHWDPSMLVVVPVGALLERNVFPAQFGGDIWKPTEMYDSSKRTIVLNSALSEDGCGSNGRRMMIPKSGNSKGDCGCRCPHTAGSYSRDNTPRMKNRPILVLNDILEPNGGFDPLPRSSASTSVASSATKQNDGSERKHINLFASLKLGGDVLDADDDESDADSLLSSISKEISKFDGERRIERGRMLSPRGSLATSSKIYSQGVVVSCSPLAPSEDRYSTRSGDDSPWNLPN